LGLSDAAIAIDVDQAAMLVVEEYEASRLKRTLFEVVAFAFGGEQKAPAPKSANGLPSNLTPVYVDGELIGHMHEEDLSRQASEPSLHTTLDGAKWETTPSPRVI
jgi:hypothetical protein